jgi:hypothetical protein
VAAKSRGRPTLLKAMSGSVDLKWLIFADILETERLSRFGRARVPEVVTLARHLHIRLAYRIRLRRLPVLITVTVHLTFPLVLCTVTVIVTVIS